MEYVCVTRRGTTAAAGFDTATSFALVHTPYRHHRRRHPRHRRHPEQADQDLEDEESAHSVDGPSPVQTYTPCSATHTATQRHHLAPWQSQRHSTTPMQLSLLHPTQPTYLLEWTKAEIETQLSLVLAS